LDKAYQHFYAKKDFFIGLKQALAFSNKESKGFLLLTSLTFVFVAASPYLN